MKILVTGAGGFSARHLIELLRENHSNQIFSTDIDTCDLAKYSQVEKRLREIEPNQIYHLAGTFSNDYDKDYSSNVLSTKNILDSLLKLQMKCRVLLIGSAAEYGIPKKNPISEDSPLQPVTIYGLTKVFQTHLMHHYSKVYGLDLVMARTFNLLGRGVPKSLFIGRVYEQIEQIKNGAISKIVLGDLSEERDYIDVKQAVLHYQKIIQFGASGAIYNVGSGTPRKMSEILKQILEENGLPSDLVEENKAHRSSVQQIYANIENLKKLT